MVSRERLKGGILALVLGVGVLAGGGYLIYPYFHATMNAEPVEAEIISSDWHRSTNADGATNYWVDIEYQYTYDGKQYTSNSAFPGTGNDVSGPIKAETIATNYSSGDTVTAYVVGGTENRSYLIERGLPWFVYLVPAFGGLLTLLGLHNIVQGVRGIEAGPND